MVATPAQSVLESFVQFGQLRVVGPLRSLNSRLSRLADKNPLAANLAHPPNGYNSNRSRLGRDNRPKLFRKTNIANGVADALHPIVGRSGPDTVDLFTFLTLSDFLVSIGICKEYADASLLEDFRSSVSSATGNRCPFALTLVVISLVPGASLECYALGN
jgi:hypothetical protein